MLKLSDIMDSQKFADLVDQGLITERAHDEDDLLRIYSYGKQVQYSGLWTVETMNTRGLMLRLSADRVFDDAVVVGRGLPKFFTIEQMGDDWGKVKLVDDDEGVTVSETPEISWDAPAFVADKMNGALGLAYTLDGVARISTKGSFGSLEAGIATEVIVRKGIAETFANFLENEFDGKTVLFEIITPQREHPVNYFDLEDVIYLGYVENATGEWFAASEGDLVQSRFGFDFAAQHEATTLREAVKTPYEKNTEGFVVVVGSGAKQELYKVKPSEYLNLRYLFYATEGKDLVRFFTGMTGAEIMSITDASDIDLSKLSNVEETEFNAGIFERARNGVMKFVEATHTQVAKAQAEFDEIDDDLNDYYFAKEAKKSKLSGMLFKIRRGATSADLAELAKKSVVR